MEYLDFASASVETLSLTFLLLSDVIDYPAAPLKEVFVMLLAYCFLLVTVICILREATCLTLAQEQVAQSLQLVI